MKLTTIRIVIEALIQSNTLSKQTVNELNNTYLPTIASIANTDLKLLELQEFVKGVE